MTALSEAREAVRELEALQSNLAADVAAMAAAHSPHKARYDAFRKKRSKQPIVMLSANEHKRDVMADLVVGSYDGNTLVGMKAKAVTEAIAAGRAKAGLSGGYNAQGYTARGLAQRVRIPTQADLKAWAKATAAKERAQARVAALRDAEKEAAKVAFDNGAKVDVETIAASLAQEVVLRLNAAATMDRTGKAHELARLTDGEFGKLTLARRHLDHLVKKLPDAGDACVVCRNAAQEATRRANTIAEIKALPRRKFTCPTHGRVIGFFTRQREWVKIEGKADRWVDNCPLIYCPKDWHRFVLTSQLVEDDAKASKPARKTGKVRELHFICPNPECEEAVDATVAPGASYVECPECGAEWSVAAVKTVKKAAA